MQKAKYEAVPITGFETAVEDILAQEPDLVLLDINLPGTSGFDICRALRKRGLLPILILTSRDRLKDELQALNLGADDYLTKPCHKDRLLARVTCLLRREDGKGQFARIQGLSLDRMTHTIYADKRSAVLPENQGRIMELLIDHMGETVSKEMFFGKLWGTTQFIDENALQVNMTRLKKNLDSLCLGYRIVTVRGEGYSLICSEELSDE